MQQSSAGIDGNDAREIRAGGVKVRSAILKAIENIQDEGAYSAQMALE
jgi:hypothetical protein